MMTGEQERINASKTRFPKRDLALIGMFAFLLTGSVVAIIIGTTDKDKNSSKDAAYTFLFGCLLALPFAVFAAYKTDCFKNCMARLFSHNQASDPLLPSQGTQEGVSFQAV